MFRRRARAADHVLCDHPWSDRRHGLTRAGDMSDHWAEYSAVHDQSGTHSARSILDGLIEKSRLYKSSKDYQDLLEFVVRLRKFAPFNAMLLQVQKPGLLYAASERDWRVEFGRKPREGARPLLILWPFGPVALVYDVVDTVGPPLPADVIAFSASGPMTIGRLEALASLLRGNRIYVHWVDAGDANAGSIRATWRPRPDDVKQAARYAVHINCNHEPAIQFTTMVHELAHLYLGHLGRDKSRSVPQRVGLTKSQLEIEAESVAYIVCRRIGIEPKSQTYLSGYVRSDTSVDNIHVYQVMRAAGQIESILGLAERSQFEKPE